MEGMECLVPFEYIQMFDISFILCKNCKWVEV
jgi:hypothetical protein